MINLAGNELNKEDKDDFLEDGFKIFFMLTVKRPP